MPEQPFPEPVLSDLQRRGPARGGTMIRVSVVVLVVAEIAVTEPTR